MALIIPTEAQDTPAVCNWLGSLAVHNGPIRQIIAVDVRQSMANGGGPACLRLRVVADPDDIDPRFLATEGNHDGPASAIANFWPRKIVHADLLSPAPIADVRRPLRDLHDYLEFTGIALLHMHPNFN